MWHIGSDLKKSREEINLALIYIKLVLLKCIFKIISSERKYNTRNYWRNKQERNKTMQTAPNHCVIILYNCWKLQHWCKAWSLFDRNSPFSSQYLFSLPVSQDRPSLRDCTHCSRNHYIQQRSCVSKQFTICTPLVLRCVAILSGCFIQQMDLNKPVLNIWDGLLLTYSNFK